MAKVIISLKDDSRLYTYDSVLKTIKSTSRKDTSYRCYDKFEIRVDVMPREKYHKTYFIPEKILDKLKASVKIERPARIKSKELVYGMLIADSLKGYSAQRNFFYNALATQKYDKDYILDSMNFIIGNGIVKCTPAGSEKSTYSSSLFPTNDVDNFSMVRKILGINDKHQDISDIIKENSLEDSLQYGGTCYFDDDKITISELYEIRRTII